MVGIRPDLAGVGRERAPVHHLTSREHGEQGRTNANSPRGFTGPAIACGWRVSRNGER